jgi:hypothetical protein
MLVGGRPVDPMYLPLKKISPSITIRLGPEGNAVIANARRDVPQ